MKYSYIFSRLVQKGPRIKCHKEWWETLSQFYEYFFPHIRKSCETLFKFIPSVQKIAVLAFIYLWSRSIWSLMEIPRLGFFYQSKKSRFFLLCFCTYPQVKRLMLIKSKLTMQYFLSKKSLLIYSSLQSRLPIEIIFRHAWFFLKWQILGNFI